MVTVHAAGHDWNSSSPKPSRALPAFFDSLRAAEAARRKKEEQTPQAVLHTDQGSVYSSRAFCQEYEHYNFRSMSRKGTPTDNPILEAGNGWMKEKLYLDFGRQPQRTSPLFLDTYVHDFNNSRRVAALGYKSPVPYKTELGSDVMVFWVSTFRRNRLCFALFLMA